MSADGGGRGAALEPEGTLEASGPGRAEVPSESGDAAPLGVAPESPHIKPEPDEQRTEGAMPGDGAQAAGGAAAPGQGREKALCPPGAALAPRQSPAREGRTRDRQMAAALLSAWSQMPVTFEDVALYLSREEWGRLDRAQQSFYRDVLQRRSGLTLGFPLSRPFWPSQAQGKSEASSSGRGTAAEEGRGAEEPGQQDPATLEDVKACRSRAGRAPGDVEPGSRQAADGQSSGPAQDTGPPAPAEERPPSPAPPASGPPETAGQGEPGAPESSGEEGKKTYRCEQCGKGFSWHSHLATHRRTHTGEKPYACTDCGKRFGRSSHLIQHQIIHTGEKPYTCPSCWKSFSHHSTLIQHQRIHTGEKPYVCDRCAKRFTRRSDLVTHQGTHTGAKPHKCPVCGKCFTQSSALVTHQRTHTGVKPYPCPECGKCFSQRSNLIAHNRTHTGEKPYHCLDCGKSFSHSSHLTAHQRTHRGVRPYACPLCGKSFSRRSNLHRHEKIHTSGPKALAMLMLGAAGALAAPPPAPT